MIRKINKLKVQIEKAFGTVLFVSLILLISLLKLLKYTNQLLNPLILRLESFTDDNRNILKTFWLFFKFPLFLAFSISIVFSLQQEMDTELVYASPVITVIIFIIYTKTLAQLLQSSRKLTNNKKTDIKYIYIVFALIYCFMISFSILKDTIIENGVLLKWLYSITPLENSTTNQVLKIIWNSLNGLKEAILASIIFDTAFQMFNYNIKEEQKKYLDSLTKEGLLYTLTNDKLNNIPRVWYIRGDACASLIDDLGKYRFSTSSKIKLLVTDEQAAEILQHRSTMNFDDTNSLYSSYDKKKNRTEYIFDFTLIDLENCYNGGLSKEEVYDYLKDKLITLPPKVEIESRESGYYINFIIQGLLDYKDKIKRFRIRKLDLN